jgi:hypothetical protein
MPARKAGPRAGVRDGKRSVHPDVPQDRPAAAPSVPRAAPPTREWQMTPQEQDMMVCFRQDYLDLLDGRVAAIQRLVSDQELEPAQVALLSLESSSAMLGASDLVGAVRRLRAALDVATTEELEALMEGMASEAGALARRLAEPVDGVR